MTVALLAAALVLSLGGDVGGTVGSFAATIGFAGVGAVVAARTSNKVGWLLLAEGLALALALGTKDYAGRSGGASLPGAPWAGWILTLTLNAIFPALLLALLLFPDGRLPSARWRPVAWATVAAGAVGVACNAVADVNFSSNFPHLADPVTIVRAGLVRGVYNGTLEVWPFTLLACAASLAVRLVRSRGEQRLQLKWFVYASALAATTVAVASFVLPNPGLAFSAFAPLIPIGAGVAIFKYRLYDIDVVINKTLVYGALTAVLVAVYVGLAVGLGSLVGKNNSVVIAGSTLVVAALFRPARRRIQSVIDRRFYRRKYDAARTLEAFTARLRNEVDLEELRTHLLDVVGETMQPAHTSLWLRPSEAAP